MKNEFVSYETAMKLRKIGFDEPCFAFYICKGHPVMIDEIRNGKCFDSDESEGCLAPTFSQAFRWFRENHRMFHEVFIDAEPTIDNPDKLEFAYLILHMIRTEHMYTDKTKGKRFDTYEDAELSCLDRMIMALEETINV